MAWPRRSTKAGSQTRQRPPSTTASYWTRGSLNEGRVSDPATSVELFRRYTVRRVAQRRPGLRPGNVFRPGEKCVDVLHRSTKAGLRPGNVSRRSGVLFVTTGRSTKAGSQTRQRPTPPPAPTPTQRPLNEGRVSDPATSDVGVGAGRGVGVRSTKAGSQTRQRRG